MSLNDEMTNLANSVRTATGLTTKLSISDMTGYISGLYPINLLDNPSADTQTYPTENGIWGYTYWTATLSKGVYCFSLYIDSSTTTSQISTRVVNSGGTAIRSDNQSAGWGFAGIDWISPVSKDQLLSVSFTVTAPGAFSFGISGIPLTSGQVILEKPMLNAGSMPLPFTMNKLVVGSSTQPASSASQSTQPASSASQSTQSVSSATQSIQSAASPATR